MKLLEVRDILSASVMAGNENMEMVVKACAASDLMSELLMGSGENVLVLSGLNNIQLIRTCLISGFSALALVGDKKPDDAMISQATEHHLILLCTPFSMFTACGKLFQAGLRGVDSGKVS